MSLNFEDAIKIGIGLQKVDNLSVSQYFLSLINESTHDDDVFINIKENLLKHYQNNHSRTFEADLSSLNIANFLMDHDTFSLELSYLKEIHQFIFEDIFEHAGNFRTVNIYKNETILRGDTIIYTDFREIKSTLEYEFNKERSFQYKNLAKNDIIEHLTSFVASIWQIHPFREGNTRTIGVFLIKYLLSLGFDISPDPFYKHSDYFRNSLVRANFINKTLHISENLSYLNGFIRNVVFSQSNPMDNTLLIIK